MAAAPSIQVAGLTFTFPAWAADQPPRLVLRDISFDVPAGGCLAVMGSAGSGKSTLCMAVAGLAPRLTGGNLTGKIAVAGRDVQAEPIGGLADVLGVVLADPTGQLFNPTIADEIAWGLENLGVPPAQMDDRIRRALAMVGLDAIAWDQPPQTLSGGQQKRLALAAALALEPQTLVLDQPSGGLSPAGRAELIRVLKILREEHNLTVLMTESDPEFVSRLADRVVVIHDGQIAHQGTPAEVYVEVINHPKYGIVVPPALAFTEEVRQRDRAFRLALTIDEISRPSKKPHVTPMARAVLDPPEKHVHPVAIQCQDVSFRYGNGPEALRRVSLTIPRGQFAALAGENGAGKTTLARLLVGILRPTNGRILLNGVDTAGTTVGTAARQIGIAFQNPENQIFNATVAEEVAFGPRNLGRSGDELDSSITETLKTFDLEDLRDVPPAILNLSARRMVALASVAAMNTPILVLDEPTVGLDANDLERLTGWLTTAHRRGVTILLITHDMELTARCAERVIILDHGQIVADGTSPEVFNQTEILRQSGLEAPFAVQLSQRFAWPALAADLTPGGAARIWSGEQP